MMLRAATVAILVVAATAATARAQAPGEMPAEAGPGMYAPVAAAPRPESVMDNRWAVGLSVGQLTLAPKDTPDDKTQFGVGELSLRVRATPHLELELAVGGGQQQLSDGTQGDLEAHVAALGLRYRFAIEQHWNWWLMGGLGGVSVVQHGATDQQVQDANRPLGELGIGVEHRWHYFAIQAELRAVSVGPMKDQTQPVMGTASPPSTTTTTPQPPVMSTTADHLSGGQLTIGASYYF